VTASLPSTVSYVPYREIGGRPNIIVDGAPVASTELTLSHWPVNNTPDVLKRDTSTATVFAYLDTPELHSSIGIASNNHFDEDGLFSMFALCRPELALAHRDLLVRASMAGDFGVYADRDAARLCFIIEAYADRDVSPLGADFFSECEPRQIAKLYREMLDRLPAILENIDEYEELWAEQDAHLSESESLVADGSVGIDEYPELDLAVAHIPAGLPTRTVRRYLQSEQAAIHPFAINSATRSSRIVRLQGTRYDFQYRYESWVQLVSRRPQLRVDLDGLAEKLNAMEEARGTWRSEDINDVVPRVYLEGTDYSRITEGLFLETVMTHLRTASPAWDPYDWNNSGAEADV
jgi:hypothetical protein